jgi:hypothetical protein
MSKPVLKQGATVEWTFEELGISELLEGDRIFFKSEGDTSRYTYTWIFEHGRFERALAEVTAP